MDVLEVSKQMLDMGCYQVSLGDTLGVATPMDVRQLLGVLLDALPASKLAGHFHDTFGQAVANVMVAYEMGLRTFDSSVSGLGGCPYSPGAKGNVATEDVAYAFDRMGVDTGINLAELARVGDWISNQLGRANGSRAGAALIAREQRTRLPERIPQMVSTPVRRTWQQAAGEKVVLRFRGFVQEILGQRTSSSVSSSRALDSLKELIHLASKDSICFNILFAARDYLVDSVNAQSISTDSRMLKSE